MPFIFQGYMEKEENYFHDRQHPSENSCGLRSINNLLGRAECVIDDKCTVEECEMMSLMAKFEELGYEARFEKHAYTDKMTTNQKDLFDNDKLVGLLLHSETVGVDIQRIRVAFAGIGLAFAAVTWLRVQNWLHYVATSAALCCLLLVTLVDRVERLFRKQRCFLSPICVRWLKFSRTFGHFTAIRRLDSNTWMHHDSLESKAVRIRRKEVARLAGRSAVCSIWAKPQITRGNISPQRENRACNTEHRAYEVRETPPEKLVHSRNSFTTPLRSRKKRKPGELLFGSVPKRRPLPR